MEEREEAFRGIKNKKSTRQHGLNVEIFNMGVPKVLDVGVYISPTLFMKMNTTSSMKIVTTSEAWF